jgi:hypothetical protein
VPAAPTDLAAITFDDWARQPDWAGLREAATRGDWTALRAGLEALADTETLVAAIAAVADLPDIESWLTPIVAADPGDTLAAVLLARRLTFVGWKARTSARAKDVTPEQFAAFRKYLNRAEAILIVICARRPDYGPAWAARLPTGRGLGVGRSELARRYERLHQIDTGLFAAQLDYLQARLPKWYGTWDLAREFVDRCASEAPLGALGRAVAAWYHKEKWLYEVAWHDDRAGADAYLAQAAVYDELKTMARDSVWHADHRPNPGSAEVHSLLAWLFSQSGHPVDAAPHFEAVGRHPALAGWGLLDDSARCYEAAWAEAREAVRR